MLPISLEGRAAIVLGAGHPEAIGAHSAPMLGRAGASVVPADIDGDAAQATAEAIQCTWCAMTGELYSYRGFG